MMRHEEILQRVKEQPDPRDWAEDVQEHVASCAECRRTAEAAQLLRERLRALPSSNAVTPGDLRQRLMASPKEGTGEPGSSAADPRHRVETHAEVPESVAPATGPPAARAAETVAATTPTAPRGPFRAVPRWMVPLALAAGIVLGIVILQIPWGDQRRVGPESGEVPATVADYLRDVTHDLHLLERTGRPLEHRSMDADAASQWLSEGLGFDVRLPATPAGWELRGERVWHTLSRLSALVVYRGPEGQDVFVSAVPTEGLSFDDLQPVSTPAGTVWVGTGWRNTGVVWRDDDLAWAAVSELPEERLLRWVGAYRR